MGRPKKQIDEVTLLAMRGEGKHLKNISKEMGVSIPTLTRRLAVLHHNKGLFTKYRSLQSFQLTELQARILAECDEKNLTDASLFDLVRAFQVLKKAEMFIQGKESVSIHGLMNHLLAMEKNDDR